MELARRLSFGTRFWLDSPIVGTGSAVPLANVSLNFKLQPAETTPRNAFDRSASGYDDEQRPFYLGGKSWNGLAGKHR